MYMPQIIIYSWFFHSQFAFNIQEYLLSQWVQFQINIFLPTQSFSPFPYKNHYMMILIQNYLFFALSWSFFNYKKFYKKKIL